MFRSLTILSAVAALAFGTIYSPGTSSAQNIDIPTIQNGYTGDAGSLTGDLNSTASVDEFINQYAPEYRNPSFNGMGWYYHNWWEDRCCRWNNVVDLDTGDTIIDPMTGDPVQEYGSYAFWYPEVPGSFHDSGWTFLATDISNYEYVIGDSWVASSNGRYYVYNPTTGTRYETTHEGFAQMFNSAQNNQNSYATHAANAGLDINQTAEVIDFAGIDMEGSSMNSTLTAVDPNSIISALTPSNSGSGASDFHNDYDQEFYENFDWGFNTATNDSNSGGSSSNSNGTGGSNSQQTVLLGMGDPVLGNIQDEFAHTGNPFGPFIRAMR